MSVESVMGNAADVCVLSSVRNSCGDDFREQRHCLALRSKPVGLSQEAAEDPEMVRNALPDVAERSGNKGLERLLFSVLVPC